MAFVQRQGRPPWAACKVWLPPNFLLSQLFRWAIPVAL